MTLGCAAINDVVAWSLLAIVLAVQKSQKAALATASGPTQIGYKGVIKELGLVIAVVVGEFFIVGPLRAFRFPFVFSRLVEIFFYALSPLAVRLTVFNAYKRTGNLSSNRLAWALVGLFLSAWRASPGVPRLSPLMCFFPVLHQIGFETILVCWVVGYKPWGQT